MGENLIFWLRQNKWLLSGLVIAVLNPLPSGVILGIVLLTEEKLVKTGRIVLAVSVLLVVVTFLIVFLFQRKPG